MEKESVPTEFVIKLLKTEYIMQIIFSFFTIMFLFLFNAFLIYYGGLIPAISTVIGILAYKFLSLKPERISKKEGRRTPTKNLLSMEELSFITYRDDPAYVELRRELMQKTKAGAPEPFYWILIALTVLVEVLSPNRGLNLELLNDPSALIGSIILSWLFSFCCACGGDSGIFPMWRSMRMMEKFLKEHPIKTIPPTIERWWAGEMAVKSGKRPALITGLSLLFYAVGISLFGIGLVMVISGLPIYEFGREVIDMMDKLSLELTGMPFYISKQHRDIVLAGLCFAGMGGFFLLPARWMWKLMGEGAILAILASAIPITFGIFFVMDHPEKVFNYLLIIIPSIIILLIKHEWKKFL